MREIPPGAEVGDCGAPWGANKMNEHQVSLVFHTGNHLRMVKIGRPSYHDQVLFIVETAGVPCL